MQKWVIGVLIGVLKDPDVQKLLKDTAKDIIGDTVLDRLLPLLPLAVGAAANSSVQAVLRALPQVPQEVTDTVQTVLEGADAARDELNKIITDFDTGIKPLDDLLDWWRPKEGK